MDTRLQRANLNRAHHFAVFVGNGGGDFVSRLLQLNAKRRGGGGGSLFGAFARQNGGTRDHHAMTNQRAGL